MLNILSGELCLNYDLTIMFCFLKNELITFDADTLDILYNHENRWTTFSPKTKSFDESMDYVIAMVLFWIKQEDAALVVTQYSVWPQMEAVVWEGRVSVNTQRRRPDP